MSYTLSKFTMDLLDLPDEVEHQDIIVNTPAGKFLVRGIHPGTEFVEIEAVKTKDWTKDWPAAPPEVEREEAG